MCVLLGDFNLLDQESRAVSTFVDTWVQMGFVQPELLIIQYH